MSSNYGLCLVRIHRPRKTKTARTDWHGIHLVLPFPDQCTDNRAGCLDSQKRQSHGSQGRTRKCTSPTATYNYVLGPAGIGEVTIKLLLVHKVCHAIFVSARINSFRLLWFVRVCDLRTWCIMQPSGSIILRSQDWTHKMHGRSYSPHRPDGRDSVCDCLLQYLVHFGLDIKSLHKSRVVNERHPDRELWRLLMQALLFPVRISGLARTLTPQKANLRRDWTSLKTRR